MSSSRAVYIPPGKRKKKPERFHGAFTGGFSAGYFNTVDTKEGWKPSQEKKGASQKMEDFMDEQDHEEWGGPTSVRKDYHEQQQDASLSLTLSSSLSSKKIPPSMTMIPSKNKPQLSSSLASLLTVSHQTVGPRLLRVLGWREGAGAAFVPTTEQNEITMNQQQLNQQQPQDEETKILLTKKKLKQIKLQSSRIQLPPPKLDQCGLGFEAHENAPEFRRYKEQRQQLARERARGQQDVYRVSKISKVDGENGDEAATRIRNPTSNSNDYLSYEAPEDFVGKRSAAGFALRDDEDDAYDENHQQGATAMQQQKLSEEYNTEIYEPEMSDDDDDDDDEDHQPNASSSNNIKTSMRAPKNKLSTDLGGAFASWATTGNTSNKASTSKASVVGLTSNGRPPVPGFSLGGSMESHKKRYPGPDVPRAYELQRHVFGEQEHPLIFQTIARAVQLQEQESIQAKQVQENIIKMKKNMLPPPPTLLPPPSTYPHDRPLTSGNQFASLGVAMKNRFTRSSNTQNTEDSKRIGLYQPQPIEQKKEPSVETPASALKPEERASNDKPIVVSRTFHPFSPHPLVCKRFGVSAPKHAIDSNSSNANTGRSTEAAYFEQEILKGRSQGPTESEWARKKKKNVVPKNRAQEQDEEEEIPPVGIQRLPLDKLKSIFEPTSDDETDESEADTDLDSVADKDTVHDDPVALEEVTKPLHPSTEADTATIGNAVQAQADTQMIVFKEEQANEDGQQLVKYESGSSESSSLSPSHRKERKHRKRKKHRKRRSRSDDPDDDQRRKKKRKHKHRKTSSRRKERRKES